jgi:antitoxin (DNA-binding transcriptional repressor) of toxin-antitoxin stability system
MSSIRVEGSQSDLPKLLDQLSVVDEIVILKNTVPVGRLTRIPADRPRPIAGRGKGKLEIISDDDEHLQGFEEYLP